MKISVGDFNAHLGTNSVKHSFHESTNANGILLIDYAQECQLYIANTSFEKRKGKLWTYMSEMNGRKSRIDFILVNKKWKNSVMNAEAYNCFSSLGSDHRVLTAKIKLSLRTAASTPRKIRYDWSVLMDHNLQELYTINNK